MLLSVILSKDSGYLFNMAAILGGILFGLLVRRTRSLLWPWFLHFGISLCLDLFIITNRPGVT